MRCLRYKLLAWGQMLMTVLFLAIVGLFWQEACLAQDGRDKDVDQKTIHITSDILTTDNQTGLVEFSGNVRAAQGNTVIVSDRLKVIYKEDADSAQKISGGPGAIEKIIAIGNVNIDFDDKKAVADEAEYTIDTQVLVLSGTDSKVTTANESISGSKITYYRSDGRIKVEGGTGRQVEAVFYNTDDKGDQ